MNNPWESITLQDYENHMKLDTVKQLQTINLMMREQFYKYPVETIMILGIAGGNGLEHINVQKIRKVYGVDINDDYLKGCHSRYENLKDVLECFCVDLTADKRTLPGADIVIANLVIEYIGYECFQKTITKVNPHYVSCIIQINKDDGFVSDSPYLHAFDRLDEVHHQMDELELENVMRQIKFSLIGKSESDLPNGKKLVQLDFKR